MLAVAPDLVQATILSQPVPRFTPLTVTDPRKIMANNVFGVVEGEGATEVDGETLEWSRGDVIVVPSWREHVHRSETGAVLFRCTDEPVMSKLGFLREGAPAR